MGVILQVIAILGVLGIISYIIVEGAKKLAQEMPVTDMEKQLIITKYVERFGKSMAHYITYDENGTAFYTISVEDYEGEEDLAIDLECHTEGGEE